MDIRIDDRYLLFKAIQPLEDGVLYNGQDLFLKRDVFLYLLDKKGKSTRKNLDKVLVKPPGLQMNIFFIF
ncbi:hypothetical protein P7H12_23595 [Paenibacillus larvae]|nr:hypothetical protein [Paenibacillus larvae]MDT2265982.1 hypothetical protein [Paenibacillus larvae]